ncbi:MAG: homoserine O-acetyltransferase [Victivallales bacterium]|nr:homoserine O-acetyltransferase [bacterium]MDD7751842.1 homoserine O-acetyltransferase [bacterium]MDY5694997.1 homoserine O-acetyltransferase [Victivallales bacterium]
MKPEHFQNSVGKVSPQDFTFNEGLKLQCGQLLAPITLRYETYGTLSPDADNAILIEHALSGDAHVAGYYSESDEKPGWWDTMVGPGKTFDTNKYFIVCSNVIGGCSGSTGPGSMNPATGTRYGMDFPFVTIADMVHAQKKLMDHLGIRKWLCVAGGSMGGMQVLRWALLYPDCMESIIPIATTSRISAQSIAFNWVGREAIMSDPEWNGGHYTDQPDRGLAIARMLAHITYLSEESMRRKFGRKLQSAKDYSFDFDKDFSVESYLEHQGMRFVDRFDANAYLYITRAIDYFDVADKSNGDLAKGLLPIQCKTLVVSFSSDWLFPPEQSREMVRGMLKNGLDVTYCNIKSSYGHDAFLLEDDTLGRLISNFLANVKPKAAK